jgi:CRP/FNR family transcriptional regulator
MTRFKQMGMVELPGGRRLIVTDLRALRRVAAG